MQWACGVSAREREARGAIRRVVAYREDVRQRHDFDCVCRIRHPWVHGVWHQGAACVCARGWQARKHSSSRLGTRRAHARDFHGVVGPTVREWGSRATHHTPASLAIGMPRPLCPRRTTSVRRGPVRTAARASTPRTPATIGRKWPHTLINCTLPSAGRAPGTNSWPRNPSPSHSHSLPATRGGEVSGTWTFPAATATCGRSALSLRRWSGADYAHL